MTYLKNYFYIFSFTYIVIFFTKLIFLIYLYEYFENYTISILLLAILWGYKFDLAVAAIISFLATTLDSNKKLLATASSLFISFLFLVQISDIMYFYESSRHIGYEISDVLIDASGLIMTAFSQHTTLSVSSIIVSILLFKLIYNILQTKLISIRLSKIYVINKIVLLIITIFFARGMTQHIPLNPWQSNQIADAKLSSLTLNGTYNTMYSLLNKNKEVNPLKLPNIDNKTAKTMLHQLYEDKKTTITTHLNKPNIIFFFLESWSAVNMKSYGFNKTTTPFFDEILKKSIRPKAMIAGGHRTTEGMFCSLTSYQNPLGRSVAKSQLQDYSYNSIIDILNQHQYSSAFFQGTAKETSGTGSFAQKLGFKNSYGKRDIKNRIYEENDWGVHDTDLYNFTLDKLKTMKQPFTIGINGATTHNDKIPHSIKKHHFTEDSKLNNQLNALNFSDTALKNFVNTILKQYPNTLLVFQADHCGSVKGSAFENYLIPFAIYHKDLKARYYNTFISQRDLAPTIFDIIFGDDEAYPNNFTGKSLFRNENFFADYYHNGILGWIEKNQALELNTSTNQYKCYDISTLKDKEIPCRKTSIAYKNKALAFTKISQKLLFDGETKKFIDYKKSKGL